MSAIDVPCPACLVPAGEACTTPSIGGAQNTRTPVRWFHSAREAMADEQERMSTQYPDN